MVLKGASGILNWTVPNKDLWNGDNIWHHFLGRKVVGLNPDGPPRGTKCCSEAPARCRREKLTPCRSKFRSVCAVVEFAWNLPGRVAKMKFGCLKWNIEMTLVLNRWDMISWSIRTSGWFKPRRWEARHDLRSLAWSGSSEWWLINAKKFWNEIEMRKKSEISIFRNELANLEITTSLIPGVTGF
jgi:hypothetical protein